MVLQDADLKIQLQHINHHGRIQFIGETDIAYSIAWNGLFLFASCCKQEGGDDQGREKEPEDLHGVGD
jgi:hypothetical protein